MKLQPLPHLRVGALLALKPARAAAYGIDRNVNFLRVESRPGYLAPWIVCRASRGTEGHFKPSDFARVVMP